VDFTLPDTAPAVREGVAAVAAKYDHAYWSACDDEHRFPREAWRDLAAGGWVGLSFLYILTPGFGATTLARHGTPAQKRAILPGVADGTVQFCLALTEPDASSDALAITTAARRDGDDWLVRGRKIWISGVENADWMIAVTRTSSGGSRTAGWSGCSATPGSAGTSRCPRS
jgi:acyl-CoA dehydrogenase